MQDAILMTKKFALTLHYHSPKAYEYCWLASFSFISIVCIFIIPISTLFTLSIIFF